MSKLFESVISRDEKSTSKDKLKVYYFEGVLCVYSNKRKLIFGHKLKFC